MNWTAGLSWLGALGARQGERRPGGEPDHGDMGTAFGLDAAFGPVDAELRALPAPAAGDSLPWEHRLTRRTRL